MGLSTGLEYWPGSDEPLEAIAALTAMAARRGGLYATHVHNRDVYYDLGFSEVVATARHAGARLQISHIQPKFGAPAQAMQHTLELLYRARREGVDVAFDLIPHDWSHTVMASVLPAWSREGGTARTRTAAMASRRVSEQLRHDRDMQRERVVSLLTEHKPVLQQRFGVTTLALFGSVARDTASADSDVDVLVDFDGPASSKRYFGVQFYLEDLLGRPVDLVTHSALRPRLRPYIERDAIAV